MTLIFVVCIKFYLLYMILNLNDAYLIRDTYDDIISNSLETSSCKRKIKEEYQDSRLNTFENQNYSVEKNVKQKDMSKVNDSKQHIDRKKKSNNKTTPKRTTTAATKNAEPAWEPWTTWSACSVTCGKGRNIRWRHCKKNCRQVETEMEEKTCQMPACLHKLFGLIKLE